MALGEKKKFTGVLGTQVINKGSKSEHEAVVLWTDRALPLPVKLIGGNPFHEPALDPFIGKTVTLEAVEGSGVRGLFIENVADITVLDPPADGLGVRKKFTGVLAAHTVDPGLKSERQELVLLTDGALPLPVKVKSGDPLHQPSFKSYLGKRVSVEGVEGSGVHALFVDKVGDITVLGPPGRPRRPPSL
jgi:hypothetical protein